MYNVHTVSVNVHYRWRECECTSIYTFIVNVHLAVDNVSIKVHYRRRQCECTSIDNVSMNVHYRRR